jgi:uncharacterized membrane protein
MKSYKLSSISLMSLILSVLSLALVIAIGYIFKKIELTINLLSLPILLGFTSTITAVLNLVRKGNKKTLSIVVMIISIIIALSSAFLMSLLRGLWMFT